MEHFCNQRDNAFTCDAGCEFNSDCFIADRCDPLTSTCVPRACRDTQLDCPSGHRCDQTTGTCYLDPAPHCEPCSGSATCGEGGACYWLSADTQAAYCFLQCNPEAIEACPAGYSCAPTNDERFV